jgi:hypothetical protein
MATTLRDKKYVLCVENRDSDDLEKRKVYEIVADTEAEKEGYFRVVDESGEDYLYPQSYFIPISLPREAEEAIQLSK